MTAKKGIFPVKTKISEIPGLTQEILDKHLSCAIDYKNQVLGYIKNETTGTYRIVVRQSFETTAYYTILTRRLEGNKWKNSLNDRVINDYTIFLNYYREFRGVIKDEE